MRVILVPVADRPECSRALDIAFDIGHRVGASVSGCHMRPHRYSEVSMTNAFADAAWRKKSTKRAPSAAKTLYARAAENHGYKLVRRASAAPRALWSERVGSPDVLMGIVGPVSDLIVVSRPTQEGGIADMFMRAALLESSCPVLILPQTARRKIARRIVIGWNQSAEAASAVSASLSLLAEADSVTIVTCGKEDRPGPASGQLKSYLTHWGISAEHVATRGRNVESELLETYRDCKGDLLVAGAYSKQRWREKLFGGTTEYLLRKARVPLLTLHN